MTTKLGEFFTPARAAEYLGISEHRLVMLLKAEKVPFTDLSEKGDVVPWEKGRKTWGLTGDQLAALIAARARRVPDNDGRTARELELAHSAELRATIPGHDGISRLARKTPKRPRNLKPRQ